MVETFEENVPENESSLKEKEKQLGEIIDKLPNKIEIILFFNDSEDDTFGMAAKNVLQTIDKLSSNIKLKIVKPGHRLAGKWGVDRSPTILFSPGRYSIRWLGAPVGEEGRTLVEMLLLIGLGESGLSGQSKKIFKKINSNREIKVFVSPTCPYCPQQVINCVKAAIEKPELVKLEIVDVQCYNDIADKYSAESVPQTFANEVLIAQGAQQEELFVTSLEKLEEQTVFIPDSDAELVELDLLIVGAGPAGLTAGIYAARSGLKAALIERSSLGGQVATTPVVENYPGLAQVSGKTLVDIMVSHALQYVQIFEGEEVVDIKLADPIEVISTRRRFLVKTVLLATGATHRHLGVPGESDFMGRGVSYCATCDGPLFKGKKVAVIGGGDSAVTEALHLHNIGVAVTLIHRRESFRAQEFLSKNVSENDIPVLWNTEVKEIRGNGKVSELVLINNKTGEVFKHKTDGVFISIGYSPTVDMAEKIGVELTEDGYINQDSKHRTNIKNVYSAGDVEGGYKQIVTAAGQGSEAAMTIFEDIINPYWKRKK
ncbi:FAD-dependent oxidoreductase [Thermodesulfobacteriota bacterium]